MLKQSLNCAHGRHPRYYERGLTLIEWMVSITVGLILITGLVALMARQSNTQLELERSSRQIENGRYAIQLLQEDIQLAGYSGEFGAGFAEPTTFPNPCAVTAASINDALQFSVQGYDSPSTLPTSLAGTGCALNAANYLVGTDILVVRRTDTDTMGAALKPGEIYFQAGMSPWGDALSYVLGAASTTSLDTSVFNLTKKDRTTSAPLRKYLVHIYFISPCSVPKNGSTCSTDNTDDGGVSVPTLKRLELSVASGAATFQVVPLVEGIENMQIDYGVDGDTDGAPDGDYTTAPAATDWGNVMAVRVNLLARNNEPTAGYVDPKTYTLGKAGTVTPGGKFKRRVFSQVIRLINPSERRT